MSHGSLIRDLYTTFDEKWYYSQYCVTIEKLCRKSESVFDFYMRIGGRLGHDPHPDFSEIIYRRIYRDVYDALLIDEAKWGYVHYLEYGQKEDRLLPSKADAEAVRNLVVHLDPEFLIAEYDIDLKEYVSPFDFYFLNVKDLTVSPSPSFCESAYREQYADVDEAVRAGKLQSGFEHFVRTMKKELRTFLTVDEFKKKRRQDELEAKRNLLELNLPGITHTYAFDVLNMVESFTKDIDVIVEPTERLGMIVLVPNFLPEILFGGYLAFFEFLNTLKETSDIDLKLIIVNAASEDKQKWNIMRMRAHASSIARLFSSIDYVTDQRELRLYSGYKVMSYCAETHYFASVIADKIDTTPMFFIQEYEPAFHASGDTFTFSYNSFLLPHYGIYNSKVLLDYFLDKAGMRSAHGASYRYCCFENHINPLTISMKEFVDKNRDKKLRRLVFYGRPEQHATRNHFATFVLGLREALRRGYFKGDGWDFVSVGSLIYEGIFPLFENHKLRILTKLPVDDYVEFLQTGDIGVSFISTPHPGIVHFQMAKYGLITLTNITEDRPRTWLSAQNKNIIGVELLPAAIAEGLKVAVERSLDLETRYDNARSAPYLSKSDCLKPAIEAVLAEIGFLEHQISSEINTTSEETSAVEESERQRQLNTVGRG